MRGILLVDKRPEWTSFNVVSYCKRVFGTKEVGHLGTLDPMATGVLAITIGSATKLFDIFLNKSKTYIAEFTFGYSTDTLDADGKIDAVLKDFDTDKMLEVAKNSDEIVKIQDGIIPTLEQIKAVLPKFIGEIEQIPPKYSAKKINGKNAYDMARSGKEFELNPCKVKINSIEILNYNKNVLTLKIDCGAGTYIRSLSRDIAYSLNSLATMTSLRRIRLGKFDISECVDIKAMADEDIRSRLLPIDSALDYMPIIDQVDDVRRLIQGQTLILNIKDGEYRLYMYKQFVGIAVAINKHIKMIKYFKL